MFHRQFASGEWFRENLFAEREIYCPTDLVLLLPGPEHGLEVLLPAHVEDADHVGGVVEAGAVQRHVAEPRGRAVAGLLHLRLGSVEAGSLEPGLAASWQKQEQVLN